MTKPLVLTPRAARWLHTLIHDVRLGVQIPDLQAAAEAVRAVDAYVAQLPPAPGANGEAAARASRE